MPEKRTKYLIIGNSTAAVAAVEGIRGLDPEGHILLAAREDRHTYSRPLISYLLAGEIGPERMYYRGRDFYESNGVEAVLGKAVERVDAGRKAALLEDGSEVLFEKALIAAGGTPFVPPVPGLDSEGVFTFTSWDDAEAVGRYLEEKEVDAAVVIGGGLIGIKAAEALHARGVRVTIVELAGRVLPLALDEEASRMAAEAIRKAGVGLECGTTAAEVLSSEGAVSGVRLQDGRTIDCRMVVVAIGVVPNTALVKDSGIETDRGILVDERCRTSAEDIYAAGDVAQWKNTLSGESRPIPIFPNAFRQGRTAGVNMAGGDAKMESAFGMNSVEVFGLPTISAGLATAEGDGFEVLSAKDEEGRWYKRLVLENGRLVGALFAGEIDRAGVMTGLIRYRVDVSGVKDVLLTDQFGLISLPSEYRKHVVKGEGMVL